MLLTCPSCNSKYLVNSADLKPNGRKVLCANCKYEWFQKTNILNEDILPSFSEDNSFKERNTKNEKLSLSPNLPSTYVKEKKPSVINTIFVLLFLVVSLYLFWILKGEGIGILALINFYINEFYFNLKLIISDLAMIIYQIIN